MLYNVVIDIIRNHSILFHPSPVSFTRYLWHDDLVNRSHADRYRWPKVYSRIGRNVHATRHRIVQTVSDRKVVRLLREKSARRVAEMGLTISAEYITKLMERKVLRIHGSTAKRSRHLSSLSLLSFDRYCSSNFVDSLVNQTNPAPTRCSTRISGNVNCHCNSSRGTRCEMIALSLTTCLRI